MTYRRFSTGAEAVKHVMETLKGIEQKSVAVECDEERFSAIEIGVIYESSRYPLTRKPRPIAE